MKISIRMELADLGELAHYGLELAFIDELLVLFFAFECVLEFFLQSIHLLRRHPEHLHYVHSIPLRCPLLLHSLFAQLLFPVFLELTLFVEVLQRPNHTVLHLLCFFVDFAKVFVQILLKSSNQLGSRFDLLACHSFGIQKTSVQQKLKQLRPSLETFVVDLGVETVKEQYLINVRANTELKFDVLLVIAAEESILAEFDEFGREHQSEKGTKAAVGFEEPAAFEFIEVCSYVEVHLLLVIHSVGSLVVVHDVLPLLQLHQPHDVLPRVAFFEQYQEIQIPVELLLRQRDVGLDELANRGEQFDELCCQFGVLLGSEFLGVFECVATHLQVYQYGSGFLLYRFTRQVISGKQLIFAILQGFVFFYCQPMSLVASLAH